MHCCPSNGMLAYSGEAGEVGIFKERMLQDNRMRRAHTAVAGAPQPDSHILSKSCMLALCNNLQQLCSSCLL